MNQENKIIYGEVVSEQTTSFDDLLEATKGMPRVLSIEDLPEVVIAIQPTSHGKVED